MAILMAKNDDIIDWLVEAGVVRNAKDPVARVIIDFDFTKPRPVTIYVTKYAEDKMFKVIPPDLEGAKVVLSE